MKALSGSDPSMPSDPRAAEQPTRPQPGAKLTPEAVLDIWSRREPQTVYMERYGVSRWPIQSVQSGRSWRWVTADAPPPERRLKSGPRKPGQPIERVGGAA